MNRAANAPVGTPEPAEYAAWLGGDKGHDKEHGKAQGRGSARQRKRTIADLACFGGAPLFAEIRSTSNLVQPPQDAFFAAVSEAFETGRLATGRGPCVARLEARLAKLHEAEHCVTFCNGLWAIVLALRCLKLPGRDQVVMPSLTYRRLADIAAWAGLTPHFCDVCPETLAVDTQTIGACVNDSTAALLIAHPIVNLCDVQAIESFAAQRGLPLLFDAVEAAHASWGGRMLGSFGDAECYSMHASKFLNAFEAGYVTTNNGDLAERLRTLRSGDAVKDLANADWVPGFEAPLNELHAAMACASLDDLQDQIGRNLERHRRYAAALVGPPGLTRVACDGGPAGAPGLTRVACDGGPIGVNGIELVRYAEPSSGEIRTFKNTLVRLTSAWPLSRDQSIELLHAENLLVRPYYSPPLHHKPAAYATICGELPVTDRLSREYLLLPCGEFLRLEEIDRIGELLAFVEQHGSAIAARLSSRGSACGGAA
ncbi:MAG: aminotransferase class I/II-fold pyridoxal phosphate-dependent enzyme [Planctomycetales bacterium]|nr:aminotransferase class I/II-fold pyridoxal phosphate-dependent enzyme [Planctomycetales bacterium]